MPKKTAEMTAHKPPQLTYTRYALGGSFAPVKGALIFVLVLIMGGFTRSWWVAPFMVPFMLGALLVAAGETRVTLDPSKGNYREYGWLFGFTWGEEVHTWEKLSYVLVKDYNSNTYDEGVYVGTHYAYQLALILDGRKKLVLRVSENLRALRTEGQWLAKVLATEMHDRSTQHLSSGLER
jgi:Zn-dependent protease with chaperone function